MTKVNFHPKGVIPTNHAN